MRPVLFRCLDLPEPMGRYTGCGGQTKASDRPGIIGCEARTTARNLASDPRTPLRLRIELPIT